MSWIEYRNNPEWQFNPQVTTPEGRDAAERERNTRSEQVRTQLRPETDLRYGPGPRQLLDCFPAAAAAPAIHVYFHGGYWRRGDKAGSGFVAHASHALGLPTAVMGYDLCPDVTLAQIVAQALDGIEWVHRNARRLGAPSGRVILSGHSAGAQLCAMALSCDWRARGLDPAFLAGAALISGIYELEPVLHISVNEQVRLSSGDVAAVSPMQHPPRRRAPVALAVGGRESPGWIDQTRAYAAICEGAGCATEVFVMPGEDHYSMTLAAHGAANTPVMRAIAGMLASIPPSG